MTPEKLFWYVVAVFAGFAILGIIAYTVLVSVLNGWALMKMWAWFIVPWFGIRPLSITEALGLSITVGYLTHRSDLATKDEKDTATAFMSPVIYCLVTLGFAYIIHKFM